MTRGNSFSTLVIANPQSGGGKSKWLRQRVETLVRQAVPAADIVWTTKPREATELARKGLKGGYQMIVSAGGDGTLNEVVNGFFDGNKSVRSDAVLGLLPMGSGRDFFRTLGWKPYLKPCTERLAGRKTTLCDVGHMSYRTIGGAPDDHYFINIANVGLAHTMMKRVNSFPKTFGTEVAYIQGILRAFLTYKKRYVEIIIDDHHKGSQLITNIFIANGKSCGGGWRVCPDARFDDGLFDVLAIGDIQVTDFIKALPALYRGKRIEHPKVNFYRGKHIRILEGEGDVLGVEADGEPLGFIPADFKNLHHRIQLKV